MDQVECVVIGAGVIGLAVARRLAQAGREVIILEAAEGIGTVTSSRNSEVIHAGIYYAAGSLMARMCVSGRRALYDYCRDHGIPHRNCGKLIVATTPAETSRLQSIKARAEANGMCDLQALSGDAACKLEPALNCDAALLSPSTGIIDSHAFMLALRGDAEDAGAVCAFHTPLLHAKAEGDRIELEVGGAAPMSLECRLLVNAAGLDAPAVARHIDHMPIDLIPPAYLAKGNYFTCTARARRARGPSNPRHGGAGPVRSGRGVGRGHRLRRRRGAGGEILSGDPPLLADATGRRADAELFGNSTQDRAAGGCRAGFPGPGPPRPWRRRTDQFVRNRIARPDFVVGDCGLRRGTCEHVAAPKYHPNPVSPRLKYHPKAGLTARR